MPFIKGHKLYNHPNSIATRFKKGGASHLGFKHSEESNEKNRIAHLGKKTGEENPSWKGGITPLLNKIKRLSEYKFWVKKVFQRDNYICRSCKKRGMKLTAHHLVSFSFIVQILKIKSVQEAREQFMLWNIRNGVTLCDDCHKNTPNYSWRATKMPRDRNLYKSVVLGTILLYLVLPQMSYSATFGYTSSGSSFESTSEDTAIIQIGVPDESGTVTSVTLRASNAGAGSEVWKSAIFDSTPTILSPESSNGTNIGGLNWYTANFSSGPSITASVTYYVGIYQGWSVSGNARLYYDVGTSGNSKVQAGTWPTWPSSTWNNLSRNHSIYATYTADAPTSSTPTVEIKGRAEIKGNVIIR